MMTKFSQASFTPALGSFSVLPAVLSSLALSAVGVFNHFCQAYAPVAISDFLFRFLLPVYVSLEGSSLR